MRRAAGVALAAVVLVPASAGAGTTRPPLALTATPARILLTGAAEGTIRVVNPGDSPVVVDIGRAGFALDLRGRPKVVSSGGGRTASSWLEVRPRRLALAAGAGRTLTVGARLPARVEPGDHDALVLLTTRPRTGAGVAVRMRIGVVVVVRAPGHIVRRLSIRGLRVSRSRGVRRLELLIANQGNVTETLERGRVRIRLMRGGQATSRHATSLRAAERTLRPRTRGVIELPYRGRLSGWLTARVELAAQPGRPPIRRVFRIKL